MNQYNNFITTCIKKKYTNSAIYNEKFLYYFFKSRSNFINNITETDKNNKAKKNKDGLLLFLKKRAENNKISKNDQKKIIKLYKKFNVHLKISKENKNKINTKSYIYLAYLVLKIKKINWLQQLNFIMKIIDKLTLEKKINLEVNEKILIIKLITFEKKCIKKLKILA